MPSRFGSLILFHPRRVPGESSGRRDSFIAFSVLRASREDCDRVILPIRTVRQVGSLLPAARWFRGSRSASSRTARPSSSRPASTPLLRFWSVLSGSQRDHVEQPVGQHKAVAVAWPGASWHVKFLCTRCKNVSGHSYQMRPRCGKAIRPTRYFDELKPIAKGTRGIAADAARRILDLLGLLGYAWQQEDEETAERGSSAGLGQSGAR